MIYIYKFVREKFGFLTNKISISVGFLSKFTKTWMKIFTSANRRRRWKIFEIWPILLHFKVNFFAAPVKMEERSSSHQKLTADSPDGGCQRFLTGGVMAIFLLLGASYITWGDGWLKIFGFYKYSIWYRIRIANPNSESKYQIIFPK